VIATALGTGSIGMVVSTPTGEVVCTEIQPVCAALPQLGT
jgi:hypothetical protein